MQKNSHHDIQIWHFNHLRQRKSRFHFLGQIQLADLILSLHLSLGCIRGLNKSVTPRELLELILSGWHQKGPLLMVPPPRPRWKADDFIALWTLTWIRVVAYWGIAWEETYKIQKTRCKKSNVMHGEVAKMVILRLWKGSTQEMTLFVPLAQKWNALRGACSDYSCTSCFSWYLQITVASLPFKVNSVCT